MSLKEEHGRYEAGVHFVGETSQLSANRGTVTILCMPEKPLKTKNAALLFCTLGVYAEKHATIVLHHMPAECIR